MVYMALILGAMGSLHCVGMCGPIALSLPIHKLAQTQKLIAILLYNLGRVAMYGLFGAVIGLIGSASTLNQWQSPVSILIGLLLLVSVILSSHWFESIQLPKVLQINLSKLKSNLQTRLHRTNLSSFWVLGLLNGLIPCGMVYVALITAIATSTLTDSILYMVLYGLGTVPAMFITAWGGQWASLNMRQYFRKAVPYVVAITGIWLIVRGIMPYTTVSYHSSKSIPICRTPLP